MAKLDFGGLEALLHFKPGSALAVDSLNTSGVADAPTGAWAQGADSPTVPYWPTVWLDPGAEARPSARRCLGRLHDLCTMCCSQS
jgi:hypothetical protein